MCIYTQKLVCIYDTQAFIYICIKRYIHMNMGFPRGTDGKESACHAGDPGLIPELGRSPGEGNSNPLQYSCLENFMAEDPGGLLSIALKRVGQLSN